MQATCPCIVPSLPLPPTQRLTHGSPGVWLSLQVLGGEVGIEERLLRISGGMAAVANALAQVTARLVRVVVRVVVCVVVRVGLV